MRWIICFALTAALPVAALAQPPLPAGWRMMNETAIHDASGLFCPPRVTGFVFQSASTAADGAQRCTYRQDCSANPGACDIVPTVTVRTIADPAKPVADLKVTFATRGTPLVVVPDGGSAYSIVGQITGVTRSGTWTFPYRGSGVQVTSGYANANQADINAFVQSIGARLRTGLPPAMTVTAPASPTPAPSAASGARRPAQ